jgi:hypothetical protein
VLPEVCQVWRGVPGVRDWREVKAELKVPLQPLHGLFGQDLFDVSKNQPVQSRFMVVEDQCVGSYQCSKGWITAHVPMLCSVRTLSDIHVVGTKNTFQSLVYSDNIHREATRGVPFVEVLGEICNEVASQRFVLRECPLCSIECRDSCH